MGDTIIKGRMCEYVAWEDAWTCDLGEDCMDMWPGKMYGHVTWGTMCGHVAWEDAWTRDLGEECVDMWPGEDRVDTWPRVQQWSLPPGE